MPEQTIKCPECQAVIEVSNILTRDINERLRREYEAQARKQETALKAKQDEMEKREQELLEKQKAVETEVGKKLEAEKAKLWAIAQQKAKEKLDIEMSDLQKTLLEKEKKLADARKHELELREEKRKLEDAKKDLELEMLRKLDAERKNIEERAKEAAAEESRKRLLEKDHQMEQMKRTIDELKRKSEQGSMQVQGDAQEEDLKRVLQAAFPLDEIEDVPTGIRGADLVQTVKSAHGKKCGVILWESKNTKAWGGDWIKKLKDDQGIVKADICILVSQVLPEGVNDFQCLDGVWVSGYKYALALAGVLRIHLGEVHQVKQSMVGKGEKMEYLYEYLSGNEFRNRIENIVMAFSSMKADLESEKRSMQRIWSKREKEIDRVVHNTSGMYGDLQGIIGASLPAIQSLELPQGETDEDGDERLF